MGTAFITDPHGQSTKIQNLIERLPEATNFVFIGDLIDNSLGAQIDHRRTIQIVRALHDEERAKVILGNHELNAIGWSLQKEDGTFCRPHSNSNLKQHAAFLRDYPFKSADYNETIEWFKSLPLYIEEDHFRAIHAMWDDNLISRLQPYLNPDKSIKSEHWYDVFDSNHELYELTEKLLKGAEFQLPDGVSYKDKTGITRTKARVAWWKFPINDETDLRDICLSVPTEEREKLTGKPVPEELGNSTWTGSNKPTFIGHYTLPPSDAPETLSDNIICVDFNAARDENPLWCYLATRLSPLVGQFIKFE